MNISRQVRRANERASKKNGGRSPAKAIEVEGLAEVTKLLSQFEQVAGAGEEIGKLSQLLPGFSAQLEEAQEMLAEVLRETSELKEELDRQRWVSLRIASCVHPLDPCDVEGVLALEARFRGEYDALQLLRSIAALASKDNSEP